MNTSIHSRTASEVFGVDLTDVGPDMRRMAKAVNFESFMASVTLVCRDLDNKKRSGSLLTSIMNGTPELSSIWKRQLPRQGNKDM